MQCVDVRWFAKAVDLRIISISMWLQLVELHQLQNISGVQEEKDWSKDRSNPVALRTKQLTALN